MNLEASLGGISGILVTPYDASGEIAPGKLAPIIDKALAAGVHIPVVNGNTGEFYALTMDEAATMAREVVEMVDWRAPVLAGVGRGVRDAQMLARTSVEAGAAGLMIHQPPDPFVSPRGLVDYVKAIADVAGSIPLVLYLRNDAIGLGTIIELCELPTVKGVKWATPNPLKLADAISATPEHVVWVGGLAEIWAPVFYAVGSRGFTSGLINIWPERSVAIHAALEAGNFAEAREMITAMKPFEDLRAEEMNGTNVTAVKSALQLIGQDCGATRPPSAWPLSHDQSERLKNFLSDAGIL